MTVNNVGKTVRRGRFMAAGAAVALGLLGLTQTLPSASADGTTSQRNTFARADCIKYHWACAYLNRSGDAPNNPTLLIGERTKLPGAWAPGVAQLLPGQFVDSISWAENSLSGLSLCLYDSTTLGAGKWRIRGSAEVRPNGGRASFPYRTPMSDAADHWSLAVPGRCMRVGDTLSQTS